MSIELFLCYLPIATFLVVMGIVALIEHLIQKRVERIEKLYDQMRCERFEQILRTMKGEDND